MSTTATPTLTGTWTVDPVHSTVGFEVDYMDGNDRIGLRLTTAVDRTEFGVSWNNPLPSGEPALANDVRIVTDLQFVRAS
jgi:polyisoprenoid-binding protein YceI